MKSSTNFRGSPFNKVIAPSHLKFEFTRVQCTEIEKRSFRKMSILNASVLTKRSFFVDADNWSVENLYL